MVMTSLPDARLRKNLDLSLLLFAVLTVVLGIITLFSASKGSATPFYQKQMMFAVLGVVAMVATASYDYARLPRLSRWFYGLNITFLLYVLYFVPKIKGAARWINLGPIQFQPSEFAKIAMIICLAAWLQKRSEKITELPTLLASLAYIGLPMALIFKQPDLGTSLVLLAIWFGMTFIAGAKVSHLLSIALVGLILFTGMWRLDIVKQYQKDRLSAFINPEWDPKEAGYHVLQSRIAVGSGRIWGKGLLQGTQAHGKFIPENHTDFIFTVIGEEGGFVFSSLLVFLYGGILYRGSVVMAQAEDQLGRLLATGVVSLYAFHIIVNIGMTVGIMPVTGVPLPLFSYGGSNLLLNLVAIGILLSIGMRRHKLTF
ncbi:MAG: rod shape-determining protein RodA [Chthonomonadales bacterium]